MFLKCKPAEKKHIFRKQEKHELSHSNMCIIIYAKLLWVKILFGGLQFNKTKQHKYMCCCFFKLLFYQRGGRMWFLHLLLSPLKRNFGITATQSTNVWCRNSKSCNWKLQKTSNSTIKIVLISKDKPRNHLSLCWKNKINHEIITNHCINHEKKNTNSFS